ncbi:3-phosphoglycerate dehydrogenase [Clostridiales bacterium COT073_COT-073]|nr:3-phosphoglycerate dehydrogenase [Clostridiales bacterium COT073_COT-073]
MTGVYYANPISDKGIQLFCSQYQRVEQMDKAEVVLVRSKNLIETDFGDSLLAIARAGAGVNNIPLGKCAEQGIVVFNTPGANANAVKELVIASMIMAARNVCAGMAWVKDLTGDNIAEQVEKGKSSFAGHEISGKTLGVIGLGAIGVLVANAANSLGMRVLGYDPYISVQAAWKLSRSVTPETDLEHLYEQADFITLHLPLLPATEKMLNAEAFARMKDGVILLNYARDLLVDEAALKEALSSGKVAQYMSDFPNAQIANTEKIQLMPHIGASTAESEENCAVMAVQQIMDFIENGNIKNSVNFPDCDMGKASCIRICVLHRNIPNMIGKLAGFLGAHGCNIANMVNKSRKEYAYSMFDMDNEISEELMAELKKVEGILRVRIIRPGCS